MARAFKKALADAAHVVLIDETGLFLNPLVRRTWAPKGKTPVLESWGGHRHKVSVIGAITLSPVTRRLGFYFATDPSTPLQQQTSHASWVAAATWAR